MVLGRRSKMIQMFSGSSDGTDVRTMQRLKPFQCLYTASTVIACLGQIENLNKEVDARMRDPDIKPPFKFTTLLKEFSKLQIDVEEKMIPVVHSVLPIMSSLHCGKVKLVVKSGCDRAMTVIYNMKKCRPSW